MSRLDELIQELCPDGVEYKTLGEIAIDIYRGSGITRDQLTETGIPCVRYGEIYTTYGVWFEKCVSHTDEATIVSKKYFEYGDILFAITGESVEDIAKSCAYIGHEKCLAGGDIVVLKHNQNPKYLAYVLSTTEAKKQKSKGKVKSKVVHSNVPAIKNIQIPVPPLPVQSEIVQILDNFTELMAGLTEKLAEELTARKKQYRYYMDLLLATEGTEHSLEDVCLIVDCPHTSPKWKDSGVPVVRNYNLVNGVIDITNLSYVDEEEYKIRIKRITPQEDDILFSREAPIGNVGIVPKDFRCCQGQRVVLLRPQKDIVFPQFLLYALQSGVVHEQIERVGKIGSTVSNFNISDLKKLRFTIPSIEVQMTISEKLDVFSKLCAGIFEGLSVEIEARQKQYEYYRDRLLTFKEALI